LIYGLTAFAIAGLGVAVAARHVWLQNLPKHLVPSCGPDLAYMLKRFPLVETITTVLKGSGDCAEAGWRFLGLTIAGWSLLWLTVLGLFALYLALSRR
jgi:disulfide bond formation protein DsbB